MYGWFQLRLNQEFHLFRSQRIAPWWAFKYGPFKVTLFDGKVIERPKSDSGHSFDSISDTYWSQWSDRFMLDIALRVGEKVLKACDDQLLDPKKELQAFSESFEQHSRAAFLLMAKIARNLVTTKAQATHGEKPELPYTEPHVERVMTEVNRLVESLVASSISTGWVRRFVRRNHHWFSFLAFAISVAVAALAIFV